MFSSFRKVVALSTCALCVACGLKTGESAPPPVALNTGKYNCLREIAPTVSSYLNAEMQVSEINGFFDCLTGAVERFSNVYHGHEDRDTFPAESLRQYLQRDYLSNDHVISDELLHQFMVVKKNLIGGETDRVRRDELPVLVSKLNQLRQEAVRLQPFIPLLNSRLAAQIDPNGLAEQMDRAENQLSQSVRVVSGMIVAKEPYRFSDFQSLLSEFRQFSHWDEKFQNGHTPVQWVHLLRAFKTMAVSRDAESVGPTEWFALLNRGARWYFSTIKFNVGVRLPPTVLEGPGFTNLVGWARDTRDLLKQAVESQPDHRLSFAMTNELMTALKGVDFLPTNMRPRSAEMALEKVVAKVLGTPSGVDDQSVDRLWEVLKEWGEIQYVLGEKYGFAGGEDRSLAGNLMGQSLFPESTTIRSQSDKFISQFTRDPLFKDEINHTFLVERPLLSQYQVTSGFSNLSKMNLFRAALEQIFRGYRSGLADPMTAPISMSETLAKDDLRTFYADFRDFGIDLGIVDPRNGDAGSRTFLEAKVFTYISDGEGDLPFRQALQESAFLYSGGLLSRDLYRRLEKYCGDGPSDMNGVSMLDRRCVREHLVPELLDSLAPESVEAPHSRLSAMPGYTKWLASLSVQDRESYADTLLLTAFGRCSTLHAAQMELSEFATLAMVIHYSEAVFTRYNLNLDDRLDETEIDEAAPIFGGLIRGLVRQLYPKIPSVAVTEGLSEQVLKFILTNERLPQGAGDLSSIWSHYGDSWRGQRDSWNLSLDRMKVARVFRTIISGMMTATEKNAPSCDVSDLLAERRESAQAE